MRKIIAGLILTSASFSFAASIDDVRWIAQDMRPYSYIDSKGNNVGSIVELVGEILKKTGSDKTTNDIEIRTFSKMFVWSNNKENAVFFPLAKTADREDKFKWVGPIFIGRPVVFAKIPGSSTISTDKTHKGKNLAPKFDSIQDLSKYSILGIDKYIGVMQLQDAGISVKIGASDLKNMIKLKNGEIDLVVCDKNVGSSLMQELGMENADYSVAYTLETKDMSFAFNKDTDDDLINQVQEALKTAKTKIN